MLFLIGTCLLFEGIPVKVIGYGDSPKDFKVYALQQEVNIFNDTKRIYIELFRKKWVEEHSKVIKCKNGR